MIGFALFSILLVALVVIGILAFEVWMFVDALTNKRLSDTEKLLWCLGMLLLHPFVAIAYYALVYLNRNA